MYTDIEELSKKFTLKELKIIHSVLELDIYAHKQALIRLEKVIREKEHKGNNK